MTIRTITGTVEYADGAIPQNSRLEFYLNGIHIDAVTIAHSAVYTPLDETGDIIVDLYPNDTGYGADRYNVDLVTYSDSEYIKEIRRVNLGKIYVEDVDGQILQDLLALFSGPSEPLTVAQEASADAIAAASSANTSAVEAALYDGPKVDVFDDLADVTPAQLDVGGFIRVIETGAVYTRVASGGDLDYSGTGGVMLDALPTQTGVTSYVSFAAPSSMTLDNTASIQAALNSGNDVTIPAGQWRVDGTITVGAQKTLLLNSYAWLVRTTDTANTDPVVWMNGNNAVVRGTGRNSLIRSFNNSPDGVVKLGHASLTVASAFDVLYGDISGLALYGSTSLGRTSGPADVLLHMQTTYGTPTKASYFHSVSNILFAHGNVGIKLQGNANGNIIRDLQFLRMGGNQIPGMDNAGVWVLGAKENNISEMFFNFCPNLRCIVLQNDSVGGAVTANNITDWVAEPDTGGGGTSKGVVVVSCGLLNNISGTIIGTTNDFGTVANGFWGANRRNSWRGTEENWQAVNLTLRKQSPSIVLDSTDVGGAKFQLLVTTATTAATRFGTNINNSLEMYDGGFMRPGLAYHNLGDLGSAAQAFRRVYLGTDLNIAGNKVVGARGAAVADATDAATAITQLNALLARIRAHGLIA